MADAGARTRLTRREVGGCQFALRPAASRGVHALAAEAVDDARVRLGRRRRSLQQPAQLGLARGHPRAIDLHLGPGREAPSHVAATPDAP